MLPPFYQRYVDLVPEQNLVEAISEQGRKTGSLLRSITEEKASFRYAPGKWSIKQVVGHFTDTERIFAYRALAIARGEQQSLPGYDENAYAAAANFDQLKIEDLAEVYDVTRRATVVMFRSLAKDAWDRKGVANNLSLTVRDLAYLTLGHERHHLRVLHDRYGV